MSSLRTFSTELKSQNKRWRRTGILLAAAVVFAFALNLCLGPVPLSPADILDALFGRGRDQTASRIVLFSRLPRALGCIFCGAALAVSGAVIQNILANPIAAPNVIGINTGAGLAVTASCAFFPGAYRFTPFCAFAGAVAAVSLVLLIGERTGASRLTLVLAGIAVSAVFSGGIELLITFQPNALNAYADFRIGGFSGISMRRIFPAGWVILVSLALVLALAPQLDILALGMDIAQSPGLRSRLVRVLGLGCAAALAGAAVSIAGLLGFVGLMIPHIMRRFSNGPSRPLFVFCALGGSCFVMMCDLLSRTLFSPYELPVGVVLSFCGGPFFLWLVVRRRGGWNA